MNQHVRFKKTADPDGAPPATAAGAKGAAVAFSLVYVVVLAILLLVTGSALVLDAMRRYARDTIKTMRS